MKKIRLLLTALIMSALIPASIAVSAQIPFDSYTYWENGDSRKSVYNRSVYETAFALNADELSGGTGLTGIKGICTDKKDNIYILDSASRVIVLNGKFEVTGGFGTVDGESYDDADGIYVHTDGTVYICDADGGRIIHCTAGGKLLGIITLGESSLIPEGFEFRPTRIAIDSHGFIYVVSDGSYYGALLYDSNFNLIGFYGSNTVKATAGSVISNIANRMFPNNAKKGNTVRRLPYCFNDIFIDGDDFVYTCNGYTEKYSRSGQIRKLSPGSGSNIYGSDDRNFVDEKTNESYADGAMAKQNLMSVRVDKNGFVYALESAYGRVFMYDKSGRVMTAFGGGMGHGSQVGNFSFVTGMAVLNDGEYVLVTDGEKNLLTVFKLTDFGKKVKEAAALTGGGEYSAAEPLWKDVLSQDNSFQPAYGGMAKVCLERGDYKNAVKYAKKGLDRETYAAAFEIIRSEFINKYFALFFVALIAAVSGITALAILGRRKRQSFAGNYNARQMFSASLHPVRVFTDIKEKGGGSVSLCILSASLFYIVSVSQTLNGGFLFTAYEASDFNSLWVFLQSVGFIILWIISNWLVSTLFGGKGRLKEIAVVTCYSLWPLIAEKLIYLLLTNILLPEEAGFLSILDIIATGWFVLLNIIGLISIHDFGMSRFIGTGILSFMGMAAILFLGIMIIMLVQQFGGFVATLFSEILTL